MPLTLAQQSVAKSKARFRVVCAGRRFGKTILAIRELARFARLGDKQILYVAPTYKMARDIVWTDLKNKLMDLLLNMIGYYVGNKIRGYSPL